MPRRHPWISCVRAGEPCGPLDPHDLSAGGLGLGWGGTSPPAWTQSGRWPSLEGRLPAAVPDIAVQTVALGALPADKARVFLTDNSNCCLIQPVPEGDCQFVVMPMRL